MTTNPSLDLLTGAPSDLVRRLTTRLGILRVEYQHLLESDAYLRDLHITDYTDRVRTRIADIRDEVTGISHQLEHLGYPGLAREAFQGWPTLRPSERSARTHTARSRQRQRGVSRRCPLCGTHPRSPQGGT